MTSQDLKARANALFGALPERPATSAVELEAEAAQAKIARLKALREEREKTKGGVMKGSR